MNYIYFDKALVEKESCFLSLQGVYKSSEEFLILVYNRLLYLKLSVGTFFITLNLWRALRCCHTSRPGTKNWNNSVLTAHRLNKLKEFYVQNYPKLSMRLLVIPFMVRSIDSP